MEQRGAAATTNLVGGSGGSEHALLAVPWWNWSEGEVEGVVWSVQRGSGWQIGRAHV